MNFIESLIVTIILVLCAFSAGELSKKYDKPITAKVPATYSPTQIDTLISHVDILTKLNAEQLKNDVALTNIIAEQLKYEKDFSSNH